MPYLSFFLIVGILLGFGFFLLWFDDEKIAAWRHRVKESEAAGR